MKDLRITTTAGTEAVLDEPPIEEFGSELGGELIRPEDAGYEDARKLWNGMIDKKPALIARAKDSADVAEAVNFAREHHMLLAVRGGGHNVAGTAMADGGLVVDLSSMKGIEVDPERRTVRTGEQARALGLPVSDAIPKEVHGLMSLYPQAPSRRPSVQYIPVPYGPQQARPERQNERAPR
jgi:hypothetical protein